MSSQVILVVEDEEDIQEGIRILLSGEGDPHDEDNDKDDANDGMFRFEKQL